METQHSRDSCSAQSKADDPDLSDHFSHRLWGNLASFRCVCVVSKQLDSDTISVELFLFASLAHLKMSNQKMEVYLIV